MSKTYTYTHDAMKTVFTLRLVSNDAESAKNAALGCIQRINEIEERLSRYIQGSDVWQINHLESDESIFVSEDCHHCLLLAAKANAATEGLFDSTLGRQIEHRKQALAGAIPDQAGQLMIDPDRPAIHCIEKGREIDLGGIGKGFALDCLVEECREWGIESGLLSAGASTQIAFGSKPWEITLQGDQHSLQIGLQNQAISASGTAIQGSHIISPLGEVNGYPRTRVWVVEKSAAMSDAFSTAALLADDLTQLQGENKSMHVYSETCQGISTLN